MHQEDFANRIGIPVATIRSIEGGRRPMTKGNCLGQILVTLLAVWNVRKGEWRVLGTNAPYEKKYADMADLFDPEDPYLDDLYVHKLIERILAMFKGCPTREHRRGLLLYLSEHFKETAEGFGLHSNLEPTEPIWIQSINPVVWGKPLKKEVVFQALYKNELGTWSHPSPHLEDYGIFDFRTERGFQAADYPAKTAEEHDAIVEARKRDREAAAGKDANFNRTLTAPKPDKVKKRAKKKTEYRLEIES